MGHWAFPAGCERDETFSVQTQKQMIASSLLSHLSAQIIIFSAVKQVISVFSDASVLNPLLCILETLQVKTCFLYSSSDLRFKSSWGLILETSCWQFSFLNQMERGEIVPVTSTTRPLLRLDLPVPARFPETPDQSRYLVSVCAFEPERQRSRPVIIPIADVDPYSDRPIVAWVSPHVEAVHVGLQKARCSLYLDGGTVCLSALM